MLHDTQKIEENEQIKQWIQNKIFTQINLIRLTGSERLFNNTNNEVKVNKSILIGESERIYKSKISSFKILEYRNFEEFYLTHKFFLHGTNQFVLIIDLSKIIHENKEIRNENKKIIDYWMKEIKTFQSDNSPSIIIIGINLIKKRFSNKTEQIRKKLNEMAKGNNLEIKKIYNATKTAYERLKQNLFKQIKKFENEFISNNKFNYLNAFKFLMYKLKIKEISNTINPIIKFEKLKKILFHSSIDKNVNNNYFLNLLNNKGIIKIINSLSIVIINPIWLSNSFLSIFKNIKFNNYELKNKNGIFNNQQIEINNNNLKINKKLWKQVIKIYELYQLIIQLPITKEYYIPSFLNLNKSSSSLEELNNKFSSNIENDLLLLTNENKIIKRTFEFNNRIPFYFIDKLIVKLLSFPCIILQENSCFLNHFYFYLNDNNYFHHLHIFIEIHKHEKRLINKYLSISIIFPEEINKNNFYFSFFCNFLFFSPFEILQSYYSSHHFIKNINYYNNNDNSSNRIEEIYFLDFFKNNNKIFDSEYHSCKLKKILSQTKNEILWNGKIKINPSLGLKNSVIFKEMNSIEFVKNLMNEFFLISMIKNNKFIIKCIGICIPTRSFLESKSNTNEILPPSSSSSSSSSSLKKQSEYLKFQSLLIFEDLNCGNFINCKEKLIPYSFRFKIKIAFDIIRGLNELYLFFGSNSIKLHHGIIIHPKNIFIYNFNADHISSLSSVHGKLGNFDQIEDKHENFRYYAPEILHDSPFLSFNNSEKIDVYSFGIILWELLSDGLIPYQSHLSLDNTIRNRILNGKRPSTTHLPSKVPELYN